MGDQFVPELGQAVFGNPTGEYDAPDYVGALFDAIETQIARVYWNRNQRQFDRYDSDGPGLSGITYRPYFWGDDEAQAALPNFTFEDVEIRWYKHPGRGMSTNKGWTPAEWVAWFDRCMAAVRAQDVED